MQDNMAPIAHAVVEEVDDDFDPHESTTYPQASDSDTETPAPVMCGGLSTLCAVVATEDPSKKLQGEDDCNTTEMAEMGRPRRTRHRFSWRHTTILERVFHNDPFPPQVRMHRSVQL